MPPPPPVLVDDLIREILLRLPAGDPASLLRSSLVCKAWRGLLSDGAFHSQYRAFHRTPPVLGFFHHNYGNGGRGVPQFVPTIKASPPVLQVQPPAGAIADCRHGRVLFQTHHGGHRSPTLTVWDPITGHQTRISAAPAHPYDNDTDFMAAVLCATDGCDHLGCSGGPFLVVNVGVYYGDHDDDDGDGDDDPNAGHVAWARLYSSETGVWSAPTSVALDSCVENMLPSLLAGDAIYFILDNGEKILKYSLVGGALSVISGPPQGDEPNMIFVAVQDGELGAATLEDYSLHLWSWKTTDPDGDGSAGEWARCRVIELDVMIPISIGDPSTMLDLAGFAEGTGTVFVNANQDMFTVDLKSGQITKTGKQSAFSPIFPFVSFYTPDLVTARVEGINED